MPSQHLYPSYRQTDLPWLGRIPAHWDLKRLSMIGSFSASGIDKKTVEGESTVRMVNYTNVYGNSSHELWDSQEFMITTAPKNKVVEHNVRKGDILFTPSSETADEIGLSAVAMEDLDNTVYSYHLIRFRPSIELDLRFKKYFCNHPTVLGQFTFASKGTTRQILTRQDFRNIWVVLPLFTEQRNIAAYLDRQTAKIDALIAKKQRLLDLLAEQRAALISHAVTKGLDPAAPMKDSGVQWLRDVPAHWEARQFKHVAEISYGLTLELDRTETEGTCILSLPNVTKAGQLVLDDVPKTPLTPEQKKRLLLRKGDLLFNWRNGSADHVGKTAYFDAEGEYTHVSFLLRLRFDPSKFDSRYYQMFLNNLRNTEFFSSSKTRVNTTYNQTELGRLEIVVPPLPEQRAIAVYLDRETAKIDALIAKVRQAIETLKEYRTALISAAVTGKIDVRDT